MLLARMRFGSARFVANQYIVEFGSTSIRVADHVCPPSFERWTTPRSPGTSLPLATKITSGSSAFTATPRQYDTWSRSADLGNACSVQVAPSSALVKIPSGVVTWIFELRPALTATPWTSVLLSLGPSCGRCVQLSPPSRLRNTPPSSTPAQTLRWSRGSITRFVTLGGPMGHSSAILMDNFSHRLPPSVERKTVGGLVPTRMTSESAGSSAMDQICIPRIGDSSSVKLIPLSSLR